MQVFQKNLLLPQPKARRPSSPASSGAFYPWPHWGNIRRPLRFPHRIALPNRFGIALIGLVIGVVCSLPSPAEGSAHVYANASEEQWPRASAMVGNLAIPDDEIAHAAKLDLAARNSAVQTQTTEVARWLFSSMANPEARLDAKRGAGILESFMNTSGSGTKSFWAEFSLATFQKLAGEDLAVVGTLGRALKYAETDDVSPDVIARTKGIMGHAQQSRGMLDQAKRTFGDLGNDPIERSHATVHLGEIALSTRGVEAGLEIWMTHPQGTTAAVTVIVTEADALWSLNPEKSYELVAEALARLKPKVTLAAPELQTAVSRLTARSRENAVLSATEGTAIASEETTQE
jgi:hypothetical protein